MLVRFIATDGLDPEIIRNGNLLRQKERAQQQPPPETTHDE